MEFRKFCRVFLGFAGIWVLIYLWISRDTRATEQTLWEGISGPAALPLAEYVVSPLHKASKFTAKVVLFVVSTNRQQEQKSSESSWKESQSKRTKHHQRLKLRCAPTKVTIQRCRDGEDNDSRCAHD